MWCCILKTSGYIHVSSLPPSPGGLLMSLANVHPFSIWFSIYRHQTRAVSKKKATQFDPKTFLINAKMFSTSKEAKSAQRC
jgi:hypothetical protein